MYVVRLHHGGTGSIEILRTHNPLRADAAYRRLMSCRRLWATKSAAALHYGGAQIEWRRFDRIMPVDDELKKAMRRGEPLRYARVNPLLFVDAGKYIPSPLNGHPVLARRQSVPVMLCIHHSDRADCPIPPGDWPPAQQYEGLPEYRSAALGGWPV